MEANSKKNKKPLGLLKTILVYLFLFYVAFVAADLILLKFVRPKFMVTATSKDLQDSSGGREAETRSFDDSEIGSKNSVLAKILDRNIFNSGDMPEPIANQKQDEEEEFEDNDPVLTSLPLTLQGTAVHRNPFRSLATIANSGETKSYAVGDEIDGMAEIVSVVRKKVIFRNLNNRRLEFVEITRDQIAKPTARSPQRPSFSRPVKTESMIQRDGNRFTAKRSDVNKQLGNIASIARQAKSRPYRDPATGELMGYQVYDIQKGSLIEQAGVQDGDVIKQVNDQDISNPAKAMQTFNKLKTASEINVIVNRDGRDVVLEYVIE